MVFDRSPAALNAVYFSIIEAPSDRSAGLTAVISYWVGALWLILGMPKRQGLQQRGSCVIHWWDWDDELLAWRADTKCYEINQGIIQAFFGVSG